MKARILILGVCSFIVLPSCMHPVEQALHQQKQRQLELHGTIAMGACDGVGQYIAGNLGDQRLTLSVAPQITAAR